MQFDSLQTRDTIAGCERMCSVATLTTSRVTDSFGMAEYHDGAAGLLIAGVTEAEEQGLDDQGRSPQDCEQDHARMRRSQALL